MQACKQKAINGWDQPELRLAGELESRSTLCDVLPCPHCCYCWRARSEQRLAVPAAKAAISSQNAATLGRCRGSVAARARTVGKEGGRRVRGEY